MVWYLMTKLIQEVKEVGTFDRFFGTPTVSRMEKELKEFDDEL